MKRVRWFWSYRIHSTERWLESMASKGFMLKDMNRFTRTFTFSRTTPSWSFFLGIILAAYLVDRLSSRKYNLEHKKTLNQVAAQADSDREVARYNNQSF